MEEKRNSLVMSDWPPADGPRLRRLRVAEVLRDAVRAVPEGPTSGMGGGLTLDRLPATAVDKLIGLAGPAAQAPPQLVELRHLGGELRRIRPGHGALAAIDADYLLAVAGQITGPESIAAIHAHPRAIQTALAPWAARQMFINFAETTRDPASFWTPQDWIRSDHPIRPATQS